MNIHTMQNPPKILFFDYWTRGIHNFAPLVEPLMERNIHCSLLHIGSWRHQGIPAEEYSQGIRCRDLRYYGGDLLHALMTESPAVLLGLNYTNMMDRVIRRLCYRMGIRTVYMMHGIRSTGEGLEMEAQAVTSKWGLAKRISRIPKYLRILNYYYASVLHSRPRDFLCLELWHYLIELAAKPGIALRTPEPFWDLRWDWALVYSVVQRQELIKRFDYHEENVIIVGNPNLDSAFALWKSPECEQTCRDYVQSIGVRSDEKIVLYIEDAMVEQGIFEWKESDRLREIRDVQEAANKAEMHLVVKLHPAANADSILQEFGDREGITVLEHGHIPELVWSSCAVVGHLSTALMLPVALGRLIIVPQWGRTPRINPYESVSHAAQSPSQMVSLLLGDRNSEKLNSPSMERFKHDQITLFDGRATERIIDHLVKTTQQPISLEASPTR